MQIFPVKSIDTGWYSCYIVKKDLYDQNIKYYTYLNVIDNDDNLSDTDENILNENLAQRSSNRFLNSSLADDSVRELNPMEFIPIKKPSTLYPESDIEDFTIKHEALTPQFNHKEDLNYVFLSEENKEKDVKKYSNNSNSNELILLTNLIPDNSEENFVNDDSKSKRIIQL